MLHVYLARFTDHVRDYEVTYVADLAWGGVYVLYDESDATGV